MKSKKSYKEPEIVGGKIQDDGRPPSPCVRCKFAWDDCREPCAKWKNYVRKWIENGD